MVVLNRIYTRTGDGGETRLATGEAVAKHEPRVSAYGEVDELNAVLGLARTEGLTAALDDILGRVQNELFDLGADLATPEREDRPLGFEALRILPDQVTRLEAEIDRLNAELSPLTSFILPGGSRGAAWLHLGRTVCRRSERAATRLASTAGERVNPEALRYLNRLSDLLFVMARAANANGADDVLWRPGATRAAAVTPEETGAASGGDG